MRCDTLHKSSTAKRLHAQQQSHIPSITKKKKCPHSYVLLSTHSHSHGFNRLSHIQHTSPPKDPSARLIRSFCCHFAIHKFKNSQDSLNNTVWDTLSHASPKNEQASHATWPQRRTRNQAQPGSGLQSRPQKDPEPFPMGRKPNIAPCGVAWGMENAKHRAVMMSPTVGTSPAQVGLELRSQMVWCSARVVPGGAGSSARLQFTCRCNKPQRQKKKTEHTRSSRTAQKYCE